MLIVLDDLQWADAPSLKMIEHVLRHELPGRVMVVATVRCPPTTRLPELDRIGPPALARDGLLTRLPVGGLPTDSVAELLRISGRDEHAAAELHAATGGNAFFLTELIRHTHGAIDGELPESIRAMIGLRLDRLDPRVVQVLNLAAVAGQAATLPILVDASGLDGDELLDATDAAVAAGLLVEDGAGRLAMPHALIGQAIRARLGRTRRLDLHRRVADGDRAGQRAEVVAGHARPPPARGRLAGRPRVAGRGRAGRRAALARHRRLRGRGGVGRARHGPRHRPDRAADDRAELALLRCDVERARGDRAGAVAAVRAAADWARTTGDPMLLARAAEGWMMSLSGVGFDIGRPPTRSSST